MSWRAEKPKFFVTEGTLLRNWRFSNHRPLHWMSACAMTWERLSLDTGDWRLNLRASNTEPLLRLNVETRGADPAPYVTQVRAALDL